MAMDKKPDWDPRAAEVQDDQIAAYDEMRGRCPVAHGGFLGWSVFKHDDIMRVVTDHETFSSNVSAHVSVPNSMDPPDHTVYREAIDPFFSESVMAAFEPVCRELASKLVAGLPRGQSVEFISDFAMKYALQAQCAFLGWPMEMQEALRLWMQKNHAATLAQDRAVLSEVAEEFAGFIRDMLEERRRAGSGGQDDVISRLMATRVNGRPLTEGEIVSVLRNWTGGEVGTLSAAVGIMVHYLAEHGAVQEELRRHPEKLDYAIDEMLRIHGPLVTNRRKTTCPVKMGEREIDEGERVTVFWVSGNRDEEVFEDPDEFKWDRDQSRNLLYGAGIHWCPGEPLARLEMRVVMEELLGNTTSIELGEGGPFPRAVYPASGYAKVRLTVR